MVYGDPEIKEVLAVTKKAAGFMSETVSTNGGYVFLYSEDLTQKWGEIPARDTQIWVQPPGTPAVGMMFLKAYDATGDPIYLDYAEKNGRCIDLGTTSCGRLALPHRFRYDRNPEDGTMKSPRDAGDGRSICSITATVHSTITRHRRRQDFCLSCTWQHWIRNTETLFSKRWIFVLEAQYPNGAWPQRYPLMFNHPHGEYADYTHYYTFNDDVISDNINLLIEAWGKLGNQAYRDAAYRAMEFYIISQLPNPQAGWAQQYTMDMKPGWGRSYEPDAVCPVQTLSNIQDLEKFYKITGDKRFLRPIPDAIDWLERSILKTGLTRRKNPRLFL